MSRSANAMQALTLLSRIEQENLNEEFANKNGTVLNSAVFAYSVISQTFSAKLSCGLISRLFTLRGKTLPTFLSGLRQTLLLGF